MFCIIEITALKLGVWIQIKFHTSGLEQTEIHTDHKPLISVSQEHWDDTMPYIQSMMKWHLRYTSELSRKPEEHLTHLA